MALRTPKQIASKIKSLKKEISLLEMARKATSKANSAIKTANKSMHHSKGRKRFGGRKRKR